MGTFHGAEFSPSGRYFAALETIHAMNPGLVLCDLSVQPLKHVRIGLGEHATTIAFSPDEKSLVICGLSQWALPPLVSAELLQ